jgi:hypothetical protein
MTCTEHSDGARVKYNYSVAYTQQTLIGIPYIDITAGQSCIDLLCLSGIMSQQKQLTLQLFVMYACRLTAQESILSCDS